MHINEMAPSLTRRTHFSAGYSARVPDEAGCYALTSASGVVLYLGWAGNLRRCFGEQAVNANMWWNTPDGRAVYFSFAAGGDPAAEVLCFVDRSWGFI